MAWNCLESGRNNDKCIRSQRRYFEKDHVHLEDKIVFIIILQTAIVINDYNSVNNNSFFYKKKKNNNFINSVFSIIMYKEFFFAFHANQCNAIFMLDCYLLILICQQLNQDINSIQFIEPSDIIWVSGTLPNCTCHCSQKFFIGCIALIPDKGNQWVQTSIFSNEFSCYLAFSTL